MDPFDQIRTPALLLKGWPLGTISYKDGVQREAFAGQLRESLDEDAVTFGGNEPAGAYDSNRGVVRNAVGLLTVGSWLERGAVDAQANDVDA
jgi:hypothetical protein